MKKNAIYLLFIFNLAVIFFFWYQGSSYFLNEKTFAGIMIALGRISGLLAEFFILLQLVLIGRISWIENEFSHNEMTSLHRTIGTYIILFLFSHPVMLTFGWGAMSEKGFWHQFQSFLTNWDDVFKALLALIIFILAIVLSLNPIRKKLKYERWHFTHLFIYIAIGLAFEHQVNTGDVSSGAGLYYWLILNYFIFGAMLLFRFLRPLYLFWFHRFKIEKIVPESNDVWSVYITGKNLEKFNFFHVAHLTETWMRTTLNQVCGLAILFHFPLLRMEKISELPSKHLEILQTE